MSESKVYAAPPKPQMKAAYYATRPTGWTRYLRTSLPWQLVRFVIINLKMIRIIGISHRPALIRTRTPPGSGTGGTA